MKYCCEIGGSLDLLCCLPASSRLSGHAVTLPGIWTSRCRSRCHATGYMEVTLSVPLCTNVTLPVAHSHLTLPYLVVTLPYHVITPLGLVVTPFGLVVTPLGFVVTLPCLVVSSSRLMVTRYGLVTSSGLVFTLPCHVITPPGLVVLPSSLV